MHAVKFRPLIGALAMCLATCAHAEITLVTDFEGGSAKVVAIDQGAKSIRIMPGGDPARGWPCWWYLRVEGLSAGDEVTLEVEPSDARLPATKTRPEKLLSADNSQPDRAHWSTNGKTWQHTQPGRKIDGGTAYAITSPGKRLWLAWGPPFTPQDSAALLKSLAAGKSGAEVFELSRSDDGRPCLALRLKEGNLPDEKRLAVWLQARQHAWECGGSWVCFGAAEWLAGDDPAARALRETCEIVFVPIVDVDNTATGNGGKECVPQDHNRDWSDKPYHAEVAAVQQQLARYAAEHRLALFVDMHVPGAGNKAPFYFAPHDDLLSELGRRNLDRFFTTSRGEFKGPLGIVADKLRTNGPSYDPLWQQISINWVAAHGNTFTVAVTLETPWNTPHSTSAGYQTVGRDLAQTIEKYLRDDPRK